MVWIFFVLESLWKVGPMEKKDDHLQKFSLLHHPLDGQRDSLLHHELLVFCQASDFYLPYQWLLFDDCHFQLNQLLQGIWI
jgi:hypothetical protein